MNYIKTAERTRVPKTHCFEIIKQDQERWVEGQLTSYTASTFGSGRPKKFTRQEKRNFIGVATR